MFFFTITNGLSIYTLLKLKYPNFNANKILVPFKVPSGSSRATASTIPIEILCCASSVYRFSTVSAPHVLPYFLFWRTSRVRSLLLIEFFNFFFYFVSLDSFRCFPRLCTHYTVANELRILSSVILYKFIPLSSNIFNLVIFSDPWLTILHLLDQVILQKYLVNITIIQIFNLSPITYACAFGTSNLFIFLLVT